MNEYKLNCRTLDSLDINYSPYDLVITNPPYNALAD